MFLLRRLVRHKKVAEIVKRLYFHPKQTPKELEKLNHVDTYPEGKNNKLSMY